MIPKATFVLKRRLQLIAVPLGLIFIAIMCAGVVWHSEERPLLDVSAKVTQVANWWTDNRNDNQHLLQWISQTELFVMGDKNGKPRPFTINSHTHHLTALENLTRRLNNSFDLPLTFDLSPDSTKLLLASTHSHTICAYGLDGVEIRRWIANSPTEPRWNADSVGWTAAVTQSDSRETRHISGDVNNSDVYNVTSKNHPENGTSHPDVQNESYNEFQIQLVGEIAAFKTRTSNNLTRMVTLKAPEGRTINDLIESPDGKLIAWELNCKQVHKYSMVFRFPWLRHFMKAPPARRVELWVSKSDGSEMHEIGWYPLEEDVAEDDTGPKLYTWRYDSNGLSFVVDGYLYTVPI